MKEWFPVLMVFIAVLIQNIRVVCKTKGDFHRRLRRSYDGEGMYSLLAHVVLVIAVLVGQSCSHPAMLLCLTIIGAIAWIASIIVNVKLKRVDIIFSVMAMIEIMVCCSILNAAVEDMGKIATFVAFVICTFCAITVMLTSEKKRKEGGRSKNNEKKLPWKERGK